ncbi:MAG: tetratricopeptide repeat protein, partial [Gemmatimonadetes bacterium]|nr:tetratricopeptide repeat protein [Gemmatimonadota bacterium]
MTSLPPLPMVRVEQALRLLPEIEVLAPLRALLVAVARTDDLAQWQSAGPYLTVGKRGVQPAELQKEIPRALSRIGEHLSVLYQCYVQALECQQGRDSAGAVAALLKAGEREESMSRLSQARAWYEVALALSEGLQDRRPEIEALRVLGALGLRQGRYGSAARAFQRSFVLAEAQFDQPGAIAACQGLGNVETAQGQWQGARAWYGRGLRLAEASGDGLSVGQLQHQLAALALRQGDHAAATEHLGRARQRFEELGNAVEMARLLNTEGLLEADLNRQGRASGAYMEALAWAQRSAPDHGLEVSIRLNLADLYLRTNRAYEAAQEMRRAEAVAIAQNLTPRLIEIYTFMGKLCGQQNDETGFVFFEQALELCRTLDRTPLLEGQVY